MSGLEWMAQLAVIGLLAATLPMAWRLERTLRAVRGDRAALQEGASGLGEASRQAESLLLRLRGAAEQSLREVNGGVAAADAARDDLRYLLERAETLADRLEAAVGAARPIAGGAPPPAVRSEAERDLIRALGLPR